MDIEKYRKINKQLKAVELEFNVWAKANGLLNSYEVIKLEKVIDHVPVRVNRDESLLELPLIEFFTDERVGSAGIEVHPYGCKIRTGILRYEKSLGRQLSVRDFICLDFPRELKKVYMVGEKTIQAIKVVLYHYHIT